MTKIETLLACIPDSPLKTQLVAEIAEAQRRSDALAATIAELRDTVTTEHESKSAFVSRVREILGDDPDERIEQMHRNIKRHDAWMGWMGQAHVLCSDLGIPPGHIEDRMFVAIGRIEKLRDIEKAAKNLITVRGRHHAEKAMNTLIEACK